MAASAFTVFRTAKKNIGGAAIDLSSGVYKLVLVVSGATLLSANTSASTWASLKTDGVTELTSAGNYSTSGENLAGVAWTRSGTKIMFDATDWSLSANGVDHLSIRAALIRASVNDKILCYSSLSTAAINVSAGNKLIIQFNTSGIFELN